jgi:CPA1 family monovalent cation:H+ antiporter
VDNLQQIETVVLMLVVVLALTTIAQKLVIPYPILLVVGGLAIGFVPGLPVVALGPDLVFLVFLLPILRAAYFTALRDFQANLRPITLLAFGLVAATAIARRLSIPRRIVTILEGESLVNDAAALVLYRDGTFHRLEHELDVEALRMGISELRVVPRYAGPGSDREAATA